MTIKIPDLFLLKLNDSSHENGIVHAAINEFESWFETSGTPFFPDYTDHGTKHITGVLATAAAIIPPKSAEILSAADVTIFVLGSLLHDSALHLSKTGFFHVIKGDAKNRHIKEFGDRPWPELWDEFLFSARRWNGQKMVDVFGDGFDQKSISDPFSRWEDLKLSDYKLIGEFIRWHHPRLAHEFAVFGVPGTTPSAIRLPESTTNEWRDLAGVVGRSHGLPARSCLDYIAKHYHKRDYQRIHAIYLVTVLRIADYLQIDANRAPEIVFKYRVIPSKVSELEWRVHHSVKNITPEHDDPESVEIRAQPADVETFLRLKAWLDGIQAELDTSWAVLGEVYGPSPTLKELGLNWRRIRSNLDDIDEFSKSIDFVPQRVRIEVERAELLSLLIRPLYGDDPSYGVRELIQNAVDAVKERYFFQQRFPEFQDVPLRDQNADVTVWLSDFDATQKCAWLEIADRGIGMTLNVITDYFLKAGSSFRNSETWQHLFERSDIPEDTTQPRSLVDRAGKFGLGALAAFLLSNEIEVETRHIASAEGFHFRVAPTSESITVQKISDLPIGTKVRCAIDETVVKKLRRSSQSKSKPSHWDWFMLDFPKVQRESGKSRKILQQKVTVNLAEWRKVETDLPITVHWAPKTLVKTLVDCPMLSCNGIFVSDSTALPSINKKRDGLLHRATTPSLSMPKIHVTDPDGVFGLNLTRKGLIYDEFGFEQELKDSLIKDFFCRLLLIFPENTSGPKINKICDASPFTESLDFLLSKEGFCLPFNDALSSSKEFKHLLWIARDAQLNRPENVIDQFNVDEWDCVILENGLAIEKFSRHKNRDLALGSVLQKNVPGLQIRHFRFLDNFYAEDQTSKAKATHLNFTEQVWHKTRGGSVRWMVESPGIPTGRESFGMFDPKSELWRSRPLVLELILSEPWTELLDSGELDKWWNQYFGNRWIPWRLEDRKSQFPNAWRELSSYVGYYENGGNLSEH